MEDIIFQVVLTIAVFCFECCLLYKPQPKAAEKQEHVESVEVAKVEVEDQRVVGGVIAAEEPESVIEEQKHKEVEEEGVKEVNFEIDLARLKRVDAAKICKGLRISSRVDGKPAKVGWMRDQTGCAVRAVMMPGD